MYNPKYIKVIDHEASAELLAKNLIPLGGDLVTKTVEIPSDLKLYQEYDPKTDCTVYTLTFWYDGQKMQIKQHFSSYVMAEVENVHAYIMQSFVSAWISYQDCPDEVSNYFVQEVHKLWGEVSGVKVIDKVKLDYVSVVNNPLYEQKFQDYENHPSTLSTQLPAMDVEVKLPCNCKVAQVAEAENKRKTLWSAVQHLNDREKWTFDQIADWIDELHDKGIINAEFEPWSGGEDIED